MPFADYKDFDDCVAQNQSKDDPAAYCASIEQKVEGTMSARLRAAAAAKRAQFEMDPTADMPMEDDDDSGGGGTLTLALVDPEGGEIGEIGTITYDGDPADVDSALSGVSIVFSSPDVVDLAPLQAALESIGITEAQLNSEPPSGIPAEGGTYQVVVTGGGEAVAVDADVPAPEFSWRRQTARFKAASKDAPSVDVIDKTAAHPKWQGLLVVEGIPSGDGRQIDFEALTWRNLPLPLMMMTKNPVGGSGHDGAELAGRIDWIERRDNGEIWGGGVLDSGSDAGQEAMRLLTPDPETGFTMLRGVSVDLDDVEMAFDGPDSIVNIGEADIMMPGTMRVARGRVMGATLTPFPAFQEAQVVLVSEDALVAAIIGGQCDCDNEATLVASAGLPLRSAQVRVFTPFGADGLVASAGGEDGASVIPIKPPVAWFSCPPIDEISDEPVRVGTDGRIWGFAADAKSCHIGFADRCVQTPKSHSNYRYFANKQTETAEGVMVASGPIMMDTVHPSLRMKASDAQAFYAHTGCAVADVAIYDTPKGMYIAGALRPSATPAQIRALRGSDISPDWRVINGNLECVALLAVNTSGFITPALVASAGQRGLADTVRPGRVAAEVSIATGEIVALVAAGMRAHNDSSHVNVLRQELDALRADLNLIMAEQLAARREAAAQRFKGRRQRELDTRFQQARTRFARK
jgi:hypothetical protein